jgi:hypothetical protein
MNIIVKLSLILAIILTRPAWSADIVLNEYNAVPEIAGFLEIGKVDSRFGRREGNGGDWFELVVITDHLDIRGWQVVISHRTGEPAIPGPGEEIFNLFFTQDSVWADLRSGTIVTVSEDIDLTVNDYRPETGEWWINVRANDNAAGRYITPMNFTVSNDKTQFTILNALGGVVFGPSGEGISPLAGVGSNEVFKLEANPDASIVPTSAAYTDGSSSSYGLPNPWTDIVFGPQIQDLGALRSVVPYQALISVVINEVNVHSDPPEQDWIELYNATGSEVDIGGWFLSDGKVNLMQYQIPLGTTIPSGGHIVFRELDTPLPFSLNAEVGEAVYLSEGDGFGGMTGGRDYFIFGPVENGVSYGRFPNASGPFYRMAERTEGANNSVPDFGPVVINEIMYNAQGPAADPLTGSDLEYIELRNGGLVDVPMEVDYGASGFSPWRVSGGPSFDFPPGAFIPAQGFALLVNFDPALEPLTLTAFRTHYGLLASTPIYGPNGGRLDNYTDSVNLRRPDTPSLLPPGEAPLVLRDTVTYFDFADWPTAADGGGSSLERINPNVATTDSTNWAASIPLNGTPGAENSVFVPEPSAAIQVLFGSMGLALVNGVRFRRVRSRRD